MGRRLIILSKYLNEIYKCLAQTHQEVSKNSDPTQIGSPLLYLINKK